MRAIAVFLLLVPACSGTETQVDNRSAASVPLGQPTVAEEEPAAHNPRPIQSAPDSKAHPCSIQNGEPVTHRLKAIGTEPFWAAEIEGRCVTYKTPDDQQGTRVWTRVTAGAPGIVWDGALRGKEFQLRITPKADCSDGMSDKTYSFEAVLLVDGETRHGCADEL